MAETEIPAAPSPEEMQRLMTVAQASSEAAKTEGTEAEKTEAVESAIKETASREFPAMSDKQLQELAEKLAPIVVDLSVGRMTDGMIEKLQELEVVFTPGQAAPVDTGTPEAAAQAEAAVAPEAVIEEAPRKKTFAERFSGQ